MEKLPTLTGLSHAKKDALIRHLFSQQQALQREVKQLSEVINELKAQLAKNSHNSSKPPSSDGLKKPSPKSHIAPAKREA